MEYREQIKSYDKQIEKLQKEIERLKSEKRNLQCRTIMVISAEMNGKICEYELVSGMYYEQLEQGDTVIIKNENGETQEIQIIDMKFADRDIREKLQLAFINKQALSDYEYFMNE